MNTSAMGHRGLRNGVIHTGAVALMLGAALAMNGAHAAENDADDTIARAAPPAPPAPDVQPGVPGPAAVPAPPAAPNSASRTRAARDRQRADADRRMEQAQQHMREAQQDLHSAQEHPPRSPEEADARMQAAQERLSRAAQEIASIASERAADVMENLPFSVDMRAPRRASIGVELAPDSRDGARVVDVSPGGAAEAAGIHAGDVIVAVNGNRLKSSSEPGAASREVRTLLRDVAPDTKVEIGVLRDGKQKDFEVVARPYVFSFAGMPSVVQGVGPLNLQIFGPSRELAGLEVTTLTPQLGRYFGATKGVLVLRAPKSDVYKLQDGDVILSIDGREPTSGSHITRILSSYQPGEQLTLKVMRDRKTQDIQVTLPERTRPSREATTWDGGSL